MAKAPEKKSEGGYGTTVVNDIRNKKGKKLAHYPKLIKVGDRKIRVFSDEQEAKELGKVQSSPQEEVKISGQANNQQQGASWGKPN